MEILRVWPARVFGPGAPMLRSVSSLIVRAVTVVGFVSVLLSATTTAQVKTKNQQALSSSESVSRHETIIRPASSLKTRPGLSKNQLHSADGRLQVVATQAESVKVDGVLDDEVWKRAQPITNFVQSDPMEGEPATEPTKVWVAFDTNTLYIAAYCYDEKPDELVLNDIREDFTPGSQDSFEVILDTFADRRNAFVFITNPAGARSDQQSANEGREVNTSWDAVWSVQTNVVSDGWTLEMSIPFKSLRFEQDQPFWGINFSRRIRRKNETTYWSLVPRQFQIYRVSLAGNLVGLQQGNSGRNLQVKPYVAARTLRDTGKVRFSGNGNVGLDVKYGLTPSLTLDVTVNPDFAQAEADEQEVNLTQFSQFFPEKRDFFLENSGIFFVGDVQRSRIGNRATSGPRRDTDLLPFFSRRIGLTEDGREIPVNAGGRLTGRIGGTSIGALAIQTGKTETDQSNNYSVLRVRQDISERVSFGSIFLMRQARAAVGDYNRVWGFDTNVRVFENLDWSGSFLKTQTPGLTDGQYSYRTSYLYESPVFYSRGGLLQLGENFRNDLAYYQRVGIRKWTQDFGFRLRPKGMSRFGLRELQPHANMSYYTDLSGQLAAKRIHKAFSFHFNSGASIEFANNGRFEELTSPFYIYAKGQPIPVGRYGWDEWWSRFHSDPSRTISASGTIIWGDLWSGTQRTFQGQVSIKPGYQFQADLGLQRTSAKLNLPRIDFVTSIWTLRTNYSFNTNMFFDSLLQYDRVRERVNANVRFNLIHRPLSDLFVVYNEQRFVTDEPIIPGRSVIVKFTQMMTF